MIQDIGKRKPETGIQVRQCSFRSIESAYRDRDTNRNTSRVARLLGYKFLVLLLLTFQVTFTVITGHK